VRSLTCFGVNINKRERAIAYELVPMLFNLPGYAFSL
jgi:hypothetical protein